MADWPLSYRIITVAANTEVARHQERHGAIIQRRQVMQWLDATVPDADLLATPPTGRSWSSNSVRAPRRPRSRADGLVPP